MSFLNYVSEVFSRLSLLFGNKEKAETEVKQDSSHNLNRGDSSVIKENAKTETSKPSTEIRQPVRSQRYSDIARGVPSIIRVGQSFRNIPSPPTVRQNSYLVWDLLQYIQHTEFSIIAIQSDFLVPYSLISLNENSEEYLIVKSTFNRSMFQGFTIRQIFKIKNIFNILQFHLKKLQKFRRGEAAITENLFHGTDNVNVNSICSHNFNWRLSGNSVGHRFGRGISFSPSSTYASHYPRYNQSPRSMFLTRVMVTKRCEGNGSMIIPPEGFDTTIKPDGRVIVKYDDNEFYPEYLIHYSKIDKKM